MKTTIKLILLIAGIIYLILAYSCSTKSLVNRYNRLAEKLRERGVIKDKDSIATTRIDSVWLEKTPVHVDSDSAYFMAYIDCNQESNAILTQYRIINGKYIALQKELKNNQLFITASTPKRTDTVWLPRYITQESTYERETAPPLIINELTTWQAFQIWSGRIFWILLIIYILYRVIKKVFKNTTVGQVLSKAGTFFSKRR